MKLSIDLAQPDQEDWRQLFGTGTTAFLLAAADVFAGTEEGVALRGQTILTENRKQASIYNITKNAIGFAKLGWTEARHDIARYRDAATKEGISPRELKKDLEYIALLNEYIARKNNWNTLKQSLARYTRGVTESMEYLYEYIQRCAGELEKCKTNGDSIKQALIINQLYNGLWVGTFGIANLHIKASIPKDVIKTFNDAWDRLLDKFCESVRLSEQLRTMPQDAPADALPQLMEQLRQTRGTLNLSALQAMEDVVERVQGMLQQAAKQGRDFFIQTYGAPAATVRMLLTSDQYKAACDVASHGGENATISAFKSQLSAHCAALRADKDGYFERFWWDQFCVRRSKVPKELSVPLEAAHENILVALDTLAQPGGQTPEDGVKRQATRDSLPQDARSYSALLQETFHELNPTLPNDIVFPGYQMEMGKHAQQPKPTVQHTHQATPKPSAPKPPTLG